MGDFSLPDSIAGGSSHGPDNQSLMHQPEIRSAVTSQCCFYEYLGQSIGFGEHIQKTLVQPAPKFQVSICINKMFRVMGNSPKNMIFKISWSPINTHNSWLNPNNSQSQTSPSFYCTFRKIKSLNPGVHAGNHEALPCFFMVKSLPSGKLT